LRIFLDKDAEPGLLAREKILILGYGNQGRAFALNLRDSGYRPTICLRSTSRANAIAAADGMKIIRPSRIDQAHSLIIFLIPDHLQADFYRRYLRSRISSQTTLVFAHGYAIHFRLLVPAPNLDIILVAPHGPGEDLRRKYLEGSGLSCYVAKFQNPSGLAQKKAVALAHALGCTRSGVFLTSFEQETLGDLFGEQALLCGGLAQLVCGVYETLVKNGLPPENAYLETAHQLDLLAGLIKKHGIYGMSRRISKTAQYGMLNAEGVIIDKAARIRLANLLRQIKSGAFARSWEREKQMNEANLKRFQKTLRISNLEKTGKKIRNMLRE